MVMMMMNLPSGGESGICLDLPHAFFASAVTHLLALDLEWFLYGAFWLWDWNLRALPCALAHCAVLWFLTVGLRSHGLALLLGKVWRGVETVQSFCWYFYFRSTESRLIFINPPPSAVLSFQVRLFCFVQSQGHSRGSECQWMFIWTIWSQLLKLLLWNFFFTQEWKRWCSP